MGEHNREKFRSITLERETIRNLAVIAEAEQRSMIQEVDWLVNERMKQMGVVKQRKKQILTPEVKI